MAVSSPMIYTNGEVIGVLRYVTSLKNVDKRISRLMLMTILVGLAFVSFVLFSGHFFIRSILDPVSEITATAKRIASGAYAGVQIQR